MTDRNEEFPVYIKLKMMGIITSFVTINEEKYFVPGQTECHTTVSDYFAERLKNDNIIKAISDNKKYIHTLKILV